MNVLTMSEDQFQRLKEGLSRQPHFENLVIGFLTLVESAQKREFLLRDDHVPAEEDYRTQSPSVVSLKAEKLLEILARSRDYWGAFLAHNHLGTAFFSSTDEVGIQKFARNQHDFTPGNFWLQLVWGQDGICARIGNATMCEPLDRIKVIGDNGIRLLTPLNSRYESRVPIDEARHNRTLNLLGERGLATLELLRNLSFGFIGAGGVMSAFGNVFKFLGPRSITIVDSDHVERSNANRLFGYRSGDEGTLKTDVMRRELLAFDPELQIQTVEATFPSDEALQTLKACDIWIVGPDNHFCRYWAAHYASRFMKPLLEFGSGIRLDKKRARPTALGSHFRLQLRPAKANVWCATA